MLQAIGGGGGTSTPAPPAPPPPPSTPASSVAPPITVGFPTSYVTVTPASASPPPDAATLAAAGITLQQYLDAQASGLGAAAGTQVLLAGGTTQQAVQTAVQVTQEVAAVTGAYPTGGDDGGNGGGVEEATLQAYKPSGVVAQWRDLIDVFKISAPSVQNQVRGLFSNPRSFFS